MATTYSLSRSTLRDSVCLSVELDLLADLDREGLSADVDGFAAVLNVNYRKCLLYEGSVGCGVGVLVGEVQILRFFWPVRVEGFGEHRERVDSPAPPHGHRCHLEPVGSLVGVVVVPPVHVHLCDYCESGAAPADEVHGEFFAYTELGHEVSFGRLSDGRYEGALCGVVVIEAVHTTRLYL